LQTFGLGISTKEKGEMRTVRGLYVGELIDGKGAIFSTTAALETKKNWLRQLIVLNGEGRWVSLDVGINQTNK